MKSSKNPDSLGSISTFARFKTLDSFILISRLKRQPTSYCETTCTSMSRTQGPYVRRLRDTHTLRIRAFVSPGRSGNWPDIAIDFRIQQFHPEMFFRIQEIHPEIIPGPSKKGENEKVGEEKKAQKKSGKKTERKKKEKK